MNTLLIFTAIPTVFLVFYRFKAISNQEAQKSSAEWNNIKKSLPSEIPTDRRIQSRMGYGLNGFLLFGANTNSFLDW